MTALLALLAAPIIAGSLAWGSVPSTPPPVATLPPVIHLSVAGGGVQAGQHLQVQAVVTTVSGLGEHGTVTFWIAGSSMKVGSVLDAASTAVANLGPVTTAPTIVDASFVPSGGSAAAATAEATFRASPITVTPFVSVDPAVAGSPVAVHFGLNLGPSGFTPGGHVDVMFGIATVRSGFCVLAPPSGPSVAGVWNCTATIPPLPAGNDELHIVLADSPYYSASKYVIVPVAAAPAAAPVAPKKSGGAPAPSGSSPTASASSPSDATESPSAVAAPAGGDSAASADSAPGTTSTASTSPSLGAGWWILLLVVALAAVIGAGILVVRVARRPRT